MREMKLIPSKQWSRYMVEHPVWISIDMDTIQLNVHSDTNYYLHPLIRWRYRDVKDWWANTIMMKPFNASTVSISHVGLRDWSRLWKQVATFLGSADEEEERWTEYTWVRGYETACCASWWEGVERDHVPSETLSLIYTETVLVKFPMLRGDDTDIHTAWRQGSN